MSPALLHYTAAPADYDLWFSSLMETEGTDIVTSKDVIPRVPQRDLCVLEWKTTAHQSDIVQVGAMIDPLFTKDVGASDIT